MIVTVPDYSNNQCLFIFLEKIGLFFDLNINE